MMNVWLNGQVISREAATLSITDRGFTLADGVFETIRADDGCALWLTDHLTRLRRGASTLGIVVPFSDDVLTNAVNQLLHPEALGSYSLRITLTRGPTASRGLWNAVESYKPTLLITLSSRADVGHQQLVISQSTRRNHFSPLSCIKSLNYGDSVIARREALERGATDAVLLNTLGYVACASVGNLFLRIGGQWQTPPEKDGILLGLARQRLLKPLGAVERSLSVDEIGFVDAAFVCNSLGVTAVTHLEERALDLSFDMSVCESIYTV